MLEVCIFNMHQCWFWVLLSIVLRKGCQNAVCFSVIGLVMVLFRVWIYSQNYMNGIWFCLRWFSCCMMSAFR